MTLRKGMHYEERAQRYLQQRGLRLIEKNFRSRFGEIDLIMADGENLCFIEVKYRKSLSHGGAAMTIPQSKQRKLIRTALFYLCRHRRHSQRPARFDALLIQRNRDGNDDIEWIRNAFYAE